MRYFAMLAGLAAMAAACSPAANKDKPATDNPFIGSWDVRDGQVAPWFDGSGAAPAKDPDLMDHTIVFEKSRASGSPVVACDKIIYTLSTVGPDMLFEGGLKNPEKDAKDLGFKSDQIATMNEACDSTKGDMELDFPMVDHDTILLGLNNMIYTLKRAH